MENEIVLKLFASWQRALSLLALCVGVALWPATVQAATCAEGGDVAQTVTVDTTWSGTVFIDNNVTFRDSTLTIEPGTRVVLCGAYRINIGSLFNPARLVAEGTAEAPILFEPAEESDHWQGLVLSDSLGEPSLLRHVELRRAGQSVDNNSPNAAILVSRRHALADQVSPIVDRVLITGSMGYGINISVDAQNDGHTAAISHAEITGSALAPIITDAGGVNGIARTNALTGNGIDRILVRGDNLTGGMFFSQTFRQVGVPFEIQGSIYMRDHDDDPTTGTPVLAVEPGVTLLVGPNRNITIGSLFGDARMVLAGTEEEPITIRPVEDDGDPWGTILLDAFSATDNELRHVLLDRGGGAAFEQNRAVIRNNSGGRLVLEHVEIRDALNGGLAALDGTTAINNSRFLDNNFGVYALDAVVSVRNSWFIGNAEGGIRNGRATSRCVDAVNNFWGDSGGPNDGDATADGCGNLGQSNTSPAGETVANGVLYTPWLTSVDGQIPNQGSIRPQPFWSYADGATQIVLEITLIDEAGNPLVGKEVRLTSTVGDLVQPAAPTNSSGRTTASITSDTPGFARISAVNLTDNEPAAGIATVVFGRGSAQSFGMVELEGAPYSAPNLIVEGLPFQEGFPMTFRMPMRNSNPYPVQVEVFYGFHFYGLGLEWTAVDALNKVLQPGEAWDALGGWTPGFGGHHCVQGRVSVTPLDGNLQVAKGPLAMENGGTYTVQKNLNILAGGGGNSPAPRPSLPPSDPSPPPKPPPPDCGDAPGPKDLIPTLPKNLTPSASITALRKHYTKKLPELYKHAACRIDNLTDPPVHGFDEIVTPPVYAWEPVVLEEGLTPAMVDALNAMGEQAMLMAGLTDALETTLDRMGGASIAEDWAAAAAQLDAFQDFVRQYADASDAYADGITQLLQASSAVEDVVFTPNDYLDWLTELKADGMDAEQVANLTAAGFSADQIDSITANTIRLLEEGGLETTSFFAILRDQRDNARRAARDLRRVYLPRTVQTAAQSDVGEPVPATPMVETFQVGNPTDGKATVTLTTIPVSVPASWQFSLSQTAIELEPGEQTTVYLVVTPGTETMARGSEVVVAVEGTIGNELLGGVEVRVRAPFTPVLRDVYLPAVQR